MYDQATIDSNVERIKAVKYSQAFMIPPKGGKITPENAALTEAWRAGALGFWREKQKELDDGKNKKEA